MNTECNLTGKRGRPINDLTNQRVGQLTVIALDITKTNRSNGPYWLCQCDCGGSKSVSAGHIRRKAVKSCGCFDNPFAHIGDKHPRFLGIGELSGSHYAHIKDRAKKRSIEFNVSKEYLWALFLKQERKCALSNLELSFRTIQKIADGTASLDRIDSTKGYVEGNVQWVHKNINLMKQSFTDEYFIQLCNQVATNERH
jgi:hypothetical protein